MMLKIAKAEQEFYKKMKRGKDAQTQTAPK
jgi:hypothetical protein